MTDVPAFDALKRGHVVLAPDPFKTDDESLIYDFVGHMGSSPYVEPSSLEE